MTTVIEFYVPQKDRKNTIKQLSEFFDAKHSSKAEAGLFDFSKQYCESNGSDLSLAKSIYIDSVRNIVYNFKDNGPTVQKIIKNIKKNKFNPYNLAFLKPDELNEENWIKIKTRRETSENKMKNLPSIEWKPCRVCKNIEYFFRQLQTRSADEPMTTYYICKQCGKINKVNN